MCNQYHWITDFVSYSYSLHAVHSMLNTEHFFTQFWEFMLLQIHFPFFSFFTLFRLCIQTHVHIIRCTRIHFLSSSSPLLASRIPGTYSSMQWMMQKISFFRFECRPSFPLPSSQLLGFVNRFVSSGFRSTLDPFEMRTRRSDDEPFCQLGYDLNKQ